MSDYSDDQFSIYYCNLWNDLFAWMYLHVYVLV